ncbi:MAG: UDP-2,3-diacylglucosamine diphosphatase [Gammaproteobacteria bacterium]|nr:UDP-2,3-diacylglucosamine diphosphatase [Gammaproteobacteria bacterium]
MTAINRYRNVFISDIHLGAKDAKVAFLLKLLPSIRADRIYLIGDIFDIWAMKRRVFWPTGHQRVFSALLQLSRQCQQLVFIPGNHDEALKAMHQMGWENVEILPQASLDLLDGRRALLVHGDQFDSEVCLGHWYSLVGDYAYSALLACNRGLHRVRKWLRLPYWSLSTHLKTKVKGAQSAIERFEQAASRAAIQSEHDMVICGHNHQPALNVGDVTYLNTGDWVGNCTFAAETLRGDLVLLRWSDSMNCPEEIAVQSSTLVQKAVA